jgi:hypothetical protein
MGSNIGGVKGCPINRGARVFSHLDLKTWHKVEVVAVEVSLNASDKNIDIPGKVVVIAAELISNAMTRSSISKNPKSEYLDLNEPRSPASFVLFKPATSENPACGFPVPLPPVPCESRPRRSHFPGPWTSAGKD